MEIASEAAEPYEDDSVALPHFEKLELAPSAGAAAGVIEPPLRARVRAGARDRALRLSVASRQELLWICVVYLAIRGVLLLAVYLQTSLGHVNFLGEVANWDGLWYRQLANKGYPHHVSYGQTTLGFFPLFPLSIWGLEHVLLAVTNHHLIWCATIAGILISGAGGLIATVLVHRLADRWWGRAAARRATILFIVFPGSVVFTMVYSEGLLMPLAIGCIYLLQRRRWLWAGVLAGFGTAVQPVGLMLVPVCLTASALELHRRGWRSRTAWRSLVAPVLSVTGVAAFAAFLWAWTGTPLANYIAQHHGWSEKTDPLAIWNMAMRLGDEISLSHFNQPTINLNLVVGLVGTVLLIVMLVLVFFSRRQIPAPALVWTALISFLALTSEYVPPNPRMLITAFPALMAVGRYAEGRAFRVIVWCNGILLVGLSLLTFYGHTLRP